MTSVWINYERINQISSEQTNILFTPLVSKASIAPSIQQSKKECKKECNHDIRDSNTAPDNLVKVETDENSDDDRGVTTGKNSRSKQTELSNDDHIHLDSTDDLSESSFGTTGHDDVNREVAYEALDNEIADHNDIQESPNNKTMNDNNTNEEVVTDFLLEQHPSELDQDIQNEGKVYEILSTNSKDESQKYGNVCSLIIKSPFSTFVEIDDFLNLPIFGSVGENTFEFLDPDNKLIPQLYTKLFSTTTYYPEKPYCRLICTKIHELISFANTDQIKGTKTKNILMESAVSSVHDSKSTKTKETTLPAHPPPDFIQIRVPVVVGEYAIEIILEEEVVFEEEIMGVKEISKKIVLTNCQFVPTQFSPSFGNGVTNALKGKLFIEGYIHQNIEYTPCLKRHTCSLEKETHNHFQQLNQKIVLELIVHLLQVQKVRAHFNGTEI